MKKLFLLSLLLIALSCGEPPIVFDEASKAEVAISLNGNENSLGEVLASYKGEIVLIDVWASWCADCLVGLPRLKELQVNYPQVKYVFLSVDRSQKAWKYAINKHEIQGDHYFMPDGQKGALNDFLNSNWIPRYLILDKDGNIAMYKAKRIKHPLVEETLKKLID